MREQSVLRDRPVHPVPDPERVLRPDLVGEQFLRHVPVTHRTQKAFDAVRAEVTA
jgi:hypothetical protein